jgi:opacity protein-like surface antigen
MKRLLAICVCCLVTVAPASAAKVAWVSFHGANDEGTTPSAGAAGVGFTQAPDKGYTDLLLGAGHMVNRVTVPAPGADAPLSPALLDELHAADVVILGRSVDSAGFRESTEIATWNRDILKPMIVTSGFITRGGTGTNPRLGYTTGQTVTDITGPTKLLAVNRTHPIFSGIALDANNQTGPVLDVVSFNATPQRGASINNNTLVTGGSVIASITTDNPTTGVRGGPVISEFPQGTASSGGTTFGSLRLVFMTGSREPDTINLESAGMMDLTPLGQQLFLNAVSYMAAASIPIVRGDTDSDGIVELSDFEPIRANFRNPVTMRSQGDLVSNGVVDFDDFRQWKTAFHAGGGSLAGADLGFPTSVPEPSTAAQALVVTFGMMTTFARSRSSKV